MKKIKLMQKMRGFNAKKRQHEAINELI